MARTRRSHGFTALRIEGGILPPEFLQDIAALKAPRQAGTDYGLSKSLALKEELARYWRIGNDLYASYSERRVRGDLTARRVGVDEWLAPLLRSLLGYDDLTTAESAALGDRVFKLTHRACGGAVPLLLVTRNFDLDKADPRFGYEGRRLAPNGTMQEYLNAADASLWGIVSNGSKLRILRDNPSLTRPSCIEADLDLIFEEELYPDFAALWLAAHASRLRPVDGKPSDCIIETWRAKAHETGERALENLRNSVTEALRQIGNGFLQHPDNDGLRAALSDGALSPERYFQQLLRLVYRMLFLFAAEDRDLLHEPEAGDLQRAVFAEGYSLSRLRERALRRRHYDHHQDLWQGLRITFRALASGAPVLGLPALGGLFRTGQCPDLDSAALANERLLEAVRNLAFFRSGNALARVNYRDMGAEELGSVYESLLELQPVVDVNAAPKTFGFIGADNGEKAKGSARKLTGSYYTPSALVNELIKSTLEPVLAQAVAGRPDDPRKAILDLNVVDPACGSGHFLLAAARRMAAEVARIEAGAGAADEAVRRHALREVVQHCIYGVDRNPLAVELCKTALWIETVEPGKPLTFLDSHIREGDSLVGILDPEIMANGIPGEAYKPLTGDDKAVCRDLKKRNRQAGSSVQRSLFDEDSVFEVALAVADLDGMPEDTLADIERKSAAWETAREDETRAREELRAHLFAGAFFAKKTSGAMAAVPHTEDLNRLGKNMPMRPDIEAAVRKLARQHHFFHWHLAFAEVMQCGGFDVVLGNPPWEVSQLSEEEYFAVRAPSIASLSGAGRKRSISKLKQHNLPLWQQYQIDRRDYDARNAFCRGSGRYPLTTFGKLNSYSLFAEIFLRLLSPKGRAGLIAPTGIATDHSTRAFFKEVAARERLVSLYDFENREKVFPGIDSRIKFCLLTLSGAGRPCPRAEFSFFLHQAEQLGEKERRFALSANEFGLFNPNTRTCPIFRTRRDMEIARKMYRRAGVLWKEAKGGEPEVNPWGIKFMQMLNMTSDSGLFRTRKELEGEDWRLEGNVFVRGEERYLPLYEAKLFHQYDHRFATFDGVPAEALKSGNARPMTAREKADPQTVVIPRYWVPEKEVQKRLDKSELTTYAFLEQSRAEQSRAEQSRAEQSRAEQSRAEQSRAEQSRAEQSRAEQSRAEQSRAEQSRAEQSRAEQSRAEQSRAEQSRAEQSRAEQSRAEQSRAEQSRAEQSRAEQSRAEQSRAEQSRAEQSRAEQSRAEQSRAEQSRAEQSRAEQSRAEQPSTFLPHWLAVRFQGCQPSDRRADGNLLNDSSLWSKPYSNDNRGWFLAFRNIARATDQRTSISVVLQGLAMNEGTPLVHVDYAKWLQVFRDITNATNERTVIADNILESGVGHTATLMDYPHARAVASSLVLANMNSLPLDWAARFSVGGTHMSFFIVKQLPVLPPEAYLEEAGPGLKYVELVVPRVLELTYTAHDLEGFASDLGYHGPPFPWDGSRRHRLQSELDAIFARMYLLERSDVEWILDAPSPSSSFPALKRNEVSEFGEYRTRRYVLHAYDQLARGEIPSLESV